MKVIILAGKLSTKMDSMIAVAASFGTGVLPRAQSVDAMTHIPYHVGFKVTRINTM